ncbi:bifunctional DNA primase/polymerase [Mycobacterium sp. pW045]|uniref:bifunctional DNA primase/polymerase n=1 Tax=Mycobacterium sp. pW045 TaxID=3238984 RepID=UPI00351BCEDE
MIRLPDTNGLSVFAAAMAYADAGIPVAPFDPKAGNGKECGNLLGNKRIRELLGLVDGSRWYDYATTDQRTLRRWAKTLGGFEAIATSPGRFNACVLDIDRPDKFPKPHRMACETTAHVLTRPNEHVRRGHYFFALPPELPAIGNHKDKWGEIRCLGGGLVLPPSPNDSRHVARAGKMARLPAGLYRGSGCVGAAVDLDKFCAKYTTMKYPGKLKGQAGIYRNELAKGNNPHDAMRKALQAGMAEAVIGFVPAKDVLKTLRPLWNRSAREFHSLAVWCATAAMNAETDDIEACSRRSKGTDSRLYRDKFSK